ncbi:hypothetical protein FCG40_03120 [Fimbriimonadia bacterium ATM]|nr:MAG: hypothetical protein EDM73_05250 [Armatimonadota bacterium]MBC6969269.1 hypothetical protein [Armatimonadota bacterium]MCE7899392.1 hypothetical protein [Armatimonadetes bacterium ATM1]MDL1927967.1 hypothetical protein [Fimbriimonadia bacterium ATM]RIJ97445.1 MAG: hypothetical protein DCC45_05310 [Armatimonadota bacterium]
MDLFTPKVDATRFHPNFRTIAEDAHFEPVRTVIGEWADGFPDRDGNFVIEFQTRFNQQLWELYLHKVFNQAGFAPSYDFPSPDYAITVGGANLVVEATTTQAAAGTSPEWLRHISEIRPGHNDLMFHYATVRFANAFSSKLAKIRESYLSLPHVTGKPIILAIGQYEQPLFFLCGHIPALRVLFGLDEPLYIWHERKVVIIGTASRERELKRFDAPIDLGIFRDERAKEVSAVLCSALVTTSKCQALSPVPNPDLFFFAVRFDSQGNSVFCGGPKGSYVESLVDGLHLFINPHAEYPVDPQPFIEAGIAVHTLTARPPSYDFIAPKGTLSTRTAITLRPSDSPKAIPLPERPPLPAITPWPDRELVRQPSSTFLCDEEYLSHYRGWTIHVARDREDQDWYGQAVERLVTSVHGIIEANRYEVRSIPPVSSQPSKETALNLLAGEIDKSVVEHKASES